jgi:hypothetical protein
MVEGLSMSSVRAALARCAEWDQPRAVEGNPFRLVCRLERPATIDEVAEAWPSEKLPGELRELWTTSREADLFVDADYGQWGLSLLSPAASAAMSAQEQEQRPAEMRSGDVVVGQFLGDQDLLVLDDAGGVLVALPLDERADWYRPAPNIAEFLHRYLASNGSKFWERKD